MDQENGMELTDIDRDLGDKIREWLEWDKVRETLHFDTHVTTSGGV